MSDRKTVVLLGDGMADYPVESLGGKTPLQAARTPHMDALAKNGFLGLTGTVPEGMAPGSDTANLSVFGYDPKKNYTGRAPLEAANLGIKLGPDDVAFRCNIVHIKGGLEDIHEGVMEDFSADHIDQKLAEAVIKAVGEAESKKERPMKLEFYPGVSYRNIVVEKDYFKRKKELPSFVPPHDIQGRKLEPDLLPGGEYRAYLDVMTSSAQAIADSVEIKKLKAQGIHGTPTHIWLWGAGKKPAMRPMAELYGLRGYTISAVDLIHGIGRTVGLEPWHVDGVTGYLDTNYRGKAEGLLKAFERDGCNFVFLHVESPDESGHEGNIEHKIKAIEDFDREVVGPVAEGMKRHEDYTILLMPDHPTPVALRTHSSDPVPFCVYSSKDFSVEGYTKGGVSGFSEEDAGKTGLFVPEAHRLLGYIVKRGIDRKG